MRRSAIAVPLLMVGLGLSAAPAQAGGGCGGSITEGRTTTVQLVHACFSPTIVKVPVGATVRWVNREGALHNISSPGGWFHDNFAAGTYSRRFTAAGLYPYACTLHIGMSGIVAVGSATGAPASAEGSVDAGTGAVVDRDHDTAAEAEIASHGKVDTAKTHATVPTAAASEEAGEPVLPWVAAGLLVLAAAALALGPARRRIHAAPEAEARHA